MSEPVRLYIVALEPSGDVLGAGLIDALRQETGVGVEVLGVGGPQMQAAGLTSLFDPSDLAILGIFEVLPKAGLVLRRVREVLGDIDRTQPDVLVTIDSWGFTGRVHKALAKRGSPIKRVRYVAPQVWAWRAGRAKQLARWIDHILTLFPFEPPLFEKHGLRATWVGHPVCEPRSGSAASQNLRATWSTGSNEHLLAVLPGSRTSEVRALMPVFGETVRLVAERCPGLHIGIATVPNVEAEVTAWAQTLPVPVKVVTTSDARSALFAAADSAIAASGTVTLELATAGVPHVVAYRVNPVSAFLFKRIATTNYVNLINVLSDDDIVPECLQDRCRPDVLARELSSLMVDSAARTRQRTAFARAVAQLVPDGEAPSVRAARAVLQIATDHL